MLILLIITAIGLSSMPSVSPQFPGKSPYVDRRSLSISYMLTTQGEKVHLDSSREAKENLSWIITEPLGAVAGGIVLGTAAFWSVMLRAMIKNDSEQFCTAIIAMGVGYTVGTPIGIWLTGKYAEKEKGSFLATMGASCLPVILGAVVYRDRFPEWVFAVSTGCGLVAYRLSLK